MNHSSRREEGVANSPRRWWREESTTNNQLAGAIRAGDLDNIQGALLAGANPNEAFGGNNQTALFLACNHLDNDKCLEVVSTLLEAGADPNIMPNTEEDSARQTPLHIACRRRNVRVAKALLEARAKVDSQDRWNRTPLRYACTAEDVEIVKMLLKAGANPRIQEHDNGDTPMHIACEIGNLTVVHAFLAHDADLWRAEADGGETPLHMVCRPWSFSLRVVRLLVEHGRRVDVTIKDKRGRTPYDCIMARKHPLSIQEMVLRQDYMDDRRREVAVCLFECYLERIVERHGRLSLHAILQEATYEKDDHRNNNSYMNLPLGELEMNDAATLLRLLIARISVLVEDEDGNLPIHIAWSSGAPIEVVRLLVEQNTATLHVEDRSGAFPIHIACQKSSPVEVLQFLVEQDVGALHRRDASGALPIHVACLARSSIEVFSFLLEQDKTMLQERDRLGALPIHLACRSGCMWRIIKCLVDHGGKGMLAARDPNRDLPLHVLCAASTEPSLSVLDFVIRAFPESVTRKNGNGALPFMLACETDKSECFIYHLVKKHPHVFSSE